MIWPWQRKYKVHHWHVRMWKEQEDLDCEEPEDEPKMVTKSSITCCHCKREYPQFGMYRDEFRCVRIV